MNLIKEKAKSNKKEISKDEAEKILKDSQNQDPGTENKDEKKPPKKATVKKPKTPKVQKKSQIKKIKKVSKK